MSFSVNYIHKNDLSVLVRDYESILCTRCTQSLSSLVTIRPLCTITEPVYCCLQLDWGHSDDLTDEFEKQKRKIILFSNEIFVNKPSEQFAIKMLTVK